MRVFCLFLWKCVHRWIWAGIAFSLIQRWREKEREGDTFMHLGIETKKKFKLKARAVRPAVKLPSHQPKSSLWEFQKLFPVCGIEFRFLVSCHLIKHSLHSIHDVHVYIDSILYRCIFRYSLRYQHFTLWWCCCFIGINERVD